MTNDRPKPGYEQPGVGVIPEDWEVALISELTSEVGDGIHATPLYSNNGDYYFVNGNNLLNGTIVINQDTKRAEISEFRKYRKNLTERSILLSINGTIGNLAFYRNEPIILGKSAAYLNVRNNISTQFFYYALQTRNVEDFFEDGLTGTTIRNLGLGTIRNTPIDIPGDYGEQRSISQVLSDVDALIAGLDKAIDKKRAIKTATMQQLLTGKKRLPGFGEGKGYQESEIGIIPKDWDVQTLDEMCTKIQDGTHFSPKIGRNDFYYITSKNIGRGFLNLSNAERIDTAQHEAIYRRCDVKKGDLLLTKDGVNTGNAALNDLDEEFSLLSSVALLRFKPQKYEPAYFLHLMLSSESQNRIKELVSGNAITRLTLEKIRKILFPFPLL